LYGKRGSEYIYYKRYRKKSIDRIDNKLSGKKVISAYYWNAITVCIVKFISKILLGMK